LTAGPWRLVIRGFGYMVLGPKGNIVAIVGDGSTRPNDNHRTDATAIVALPEVLQALAGAEAYFGDRPAKDEAARVVHRTIYDAMVRAGVPVVDE
jgi:hypothetical protein